MSQKTPFSVASDFPFPSSTSLWEALAKPTTNCQPPTYANQPCPLPTKNQKREAPPAGLRDSRPGFPLSAFRFCPRPPTFDLPSTFPQRNPFPLGKSLPFGKRSQNLQPLTSRRLIPNECTASLLKIKKGSASHQPALPALPPAPYRSTLIPYPLSVLTATCRGTLQ